jgi:hypothetical protein
VHCTLCTVHCTLYTVHCTLYIVHCALCTVHCTLCTVHCTLCTVHCTLCTVHCALYTVHCTLCTVHCTLCIAQVLTFLKARSIASIIKLVYKTPISIFFVACNIFATLYCCSQICLSLEREFTTQNVPNMYDARFVSTCPTLQLLITVHCMVTANVISANYVCNKRELLILKYGHA